MSTYIYRSRAAILCFGGWGLQTMLHVWPRLCLAQEQREVLGIAQLLPDLRQVTACAAILPQTAPAPDEAHAFSFHVLRPHPERYPLPFYLEHQLEQLALEPGPSGRDGARGNGAPWLTWSERAGSRLLQCAWQDGYVQPLLIQHSPSNGYPGRLPAGRSTMFRAGIAGAEAAVRALLNQVIDPTRLDVIQARDPFVQTTVYVIASLAEPLASALIWPIVSELVATLSSSHIAKVVALFCTSSFAPDDTRVVEEAAVYAALPELEALTGVRGRGPLTEAFQALVKSCGRPGWEYRVGQRLFDTVYLIDREKSNQALAQSPLELTLLVGNAIEAFLLADGASYLERSLGSDIGYKASPYSVLGTASDFIPLSEYIAQAIEEEQREVIAEEVLSAPEGVSMPPGTLAELGALPEKAIERFLNSNAFALFEEEGGQRQPAWLPALRVARAWLWPRQVQDLLRTTREPQTWDQIISARTEEASRELEEAVEGARRAWGLAELETERSAPEESTGASDEEWRARRTEAGFLPGILRLATERIVQDLVSAPNGLLRSRARISGWLHEVEQVLQELDRTRPQSEPEERYRHVLARWQRECIAASSREDRAARLWLRGLMFGIPALLVAAVAAWALLTLPLGWSQRIAVLASGLGVVAGLGLFIWFSATQQVRSLKDRRLAISQEYLSRTAYALLHRGLSVLYRRLHRELSLRLSTIQDAIDELSRWSRERQATAMCRLPGNVVHLRTPHPDDQIWQEVLGHIRAESGQGQHTRERFRELWRASGRALWDWQEEGNELALRVRAALARPAGEGGAGRALADIYRAYAARASEYLYPGNRLLGGHPDLVQRMAAGCRIERVVLQKIAAGESSSSYSQAAYVEDLCTRAKPSANYEIMHTLSSEALEVAFGVSPSGSNSELQRAFEQRNVPLLPSQDPFSLSLVRTVNRLVLQELSLYERCSREFWRLHRDDRRLLTLIPPDEVETMSRLYGTDVGDVVAYEQPIVLSNAS